MKNDLLFKKVKCNGFLKTVHDGRFIDVDKDGLGAEYIDTNITPTKLDKNTLPECFCDDSLEFLKTYKQLVQKPCEGVVVGIVKVVVSAWLVAGTNYHYTGREYIQITKEPKEVKECAIVYYANNRKHIVPLECIESEVKHG